MYTTKVIQGNNKGSGKHEQTIVEKHTECIIAFTFALPDEQLQVPIPAAIKDTCK